MNDEAHKVFSPKPMISYRSVRKLSSYLVRAKLHPVDRTFESFKCTKKRREVCKNINITDSFTSSVNQNTYKINHNLNCDDKCLIYLLTYKEYRKQYVGETTYAFHKSWNNYKSNARKFLIGESCMQRHLIGHFQSPEHTGFIENVCITLIDKTDSFISTKHEDYWIQTLKTLAPHGLNIEQSI